MTEEQQRFLSFQIMYYQLLGQYSTLATTYHAQA